MNTKQTQSEPLLSGDLLAVLRKRRKQWRTEATRLRKWANGNTSTTHRDRCLYEMNIYEACANQIDRDISDAVRAANTPVTDAEPSTPANTRAQGPRSV